MTFKLGLAMTFKLVITPRAESVLRNLKTGRARDNAKLAKVNRALRRLEHDPFHPGLSSHPYRNFKSAPPGITLWESYAENRTPAAWRIFWHYGPDEADAKVITILAITPHP